jgi:hypothetical protein
MPREVAFEIPADPSQFTPVQIRPRVLLGLSMQSLARWLDGYAVPYPSLLTRHSAAFAFTWIQLDYAEPDLRFEQAGWLAVTGRLSASATGKYLRLDIRVQTCDHRDVSRHQPVARVRADMRVVSIVEGEALSAIPGALSADLLGRFLPDEIYQPDRATIAKASTPPGGGEIAPASCLSASLYRTHCEVADQWSFIEVIELLTAARERLYVHGTAPADVGKHAVSSPVRRIVAVFHRAMFVFDTCKITTRPVETADGMVFVHTVAYPGTAGTCVTAWEAL